MKFGIIAQGSNGDIEILVSLALGLISRNHDVEMFIVTFNDRDYAFLNKKERLKVFQKHIYKKYRNEINDFEFWNESVENKKGLFFQLHQIFENDIVAYTNKFAKENDCIISLYHIYEVSCIAEKHNIPFISINFPFGYIRSKNEVPYSLTHLTDLDNGRLWDIFENYQNVYFKRTINFFRKEHGLLPIKNVLREIMTSKILNLIPYTKYLDKKKTDKDHLYKLCGYLKSPDSYNNWEPCKELLNFINCDAKPVFITVGSMTEHENDAKKFQNILLETAHLLKRRVVIHSNWEDGNVIENNVFKLSGFISYEKILSRCSVVVHHGGIGIMHHALESGCPAVIIKYGHDQFYNAKLLFDMGVSNGSINRKEINAKDLALLVNQALQDKVMKQKAEELALFIKNENGVDNAVQLIEQVMEG
jgi:UDP:flavonoid glycosyltransferase YjiC (YdhE family)